MLAMVQLAVSIGLVFHTDHPALVVYQILLSLYFYAVLSLYPFLCGTKMSPTIGTVLAYNFKVTSRATGLVLHSAASSVELIYRNSNKCRVTVLLTSYVHMNPI